MNYSKQELVKKISAHRKKEGIEGKPLSAMRQGVLLGLAKRYNLVGKDTTVGAVKKEAAKKSPAKKGAKSPAKKGKKSPAKKGKKSPAKKGKKSPAKKGKKSPAKKGAKSPAKKGKKSPAKKAAAKKEGAKKCEAGKIMNPATGRCVARDGKIGMALRGKKSPAKKGAKKVGAAMCPGKITRSGSQLKLREKESTSKKCVYTRSKSPTKKE